MAITRADLEAALPDVTSTLRAPGLERPAKVVRDGWGVPHIRAETVHDAFFAQGFATAQDRLWHMDYDRHRALGRWAELAGSAGLAEDRLMRTFGVERAAKADLAVSSGAAVAMLGAYADGVNAFIGTTASLPVEYKLVGANPEPWQPWHSLAVYKVRNMLMGTFEAKLWRARLALKLGAERAKPLFRGYPDHGLVAVPPGETYGAAERKGLDDLAAAIEELGWLGADGGGSNAWVVSGSRTASGLPLVAGDSHRALDTPNVYYQIHIACPAFRCSGYALPGVPGMPHFSHNEYVAWGMTHGVADYQDLYIERFRTERGLLEYAYRDAWLPAETTTETLAVRDGESETLEGRSHPPRAGHRGRSGWRGTASRSATPAPRAERPGPTRSTSCSSPSRRTRPKRRCGSGRSRSTTSSMPMLPASTATATGGAYPSGRCGTHGPRCRAGPASTNGVGRIPFEEMPNVAQPGCGVSSSPATTRRPRRTIPHYLNTTFAPDWRARRITARLTGIPLAHGDPGRTWRPSTPTASRSRPGSSSGACRRCGSTIPSCGPRRTCSARLGLPDGPVVGGRDDLRGNARAPVPRRGRGVAGGRRWRCVRCARQRSWRRSACGIAVRGRPVGVGARRRRADPGPDGPLGGDDRVVAAGGAGRTPRAVRHRHGRLDLGPRTRHPSEASPVTRLSGLRRPPRSAGGPDPRRRRHAAGGRPCPGRWIHGRGHVRQPLRPRPRRLAQLPLDRSARRLGPSPAAPTTPTRSERWADVETIPQLWDWDDIEAAAETRQTLVPEPSLGAP